MVRGRGANASHPGSDGRDSNGYANGDDVAQTTAVGQQRCRRRGRRCEVDSTRMIVGQKIDDLTPIESRISLLGGGKKKISACLSSNSS